MSQILEPVGVLETAQNLISNGLASSAELLLNSFLSLSPSKTHNDEGHLVQAQASVLLADSLVEGGEYPRALKLYETGYRALCNSRNFSDAHRQFVYGVKEKQAYCHARTGQLLDAIDEMEKVPVAYLTVKACKTLASWYEETLRFDQARQTYLNLLRKEPLALEAMMGALRHGHMLEDLAQCLPPSPCGDWLNRYMLCYVAIRSHQYEEALLELGRLQNEAPMNVDVMLAMADCLFKSGETMKAHYQYKQIMKRDHDVVKQMDRYALILKQRGDREQLKKHARTMSRKNPTRPESWLAMACCSEMQGDMDTALSFVDRALECNRTYAEAWLMKASLLTAAGKFDEALPAYKRAQAYDETITSFEGQVECHLQQASPIEAHLAARDAAVRMPRHPKARILVGGVLKAKGDPESKKRAKKMFEEAYRLNPLCTEAVLALVTTLEEEENWERAIEMLKEHSGHIQMATLHHRLAEIYVTRKNFDEAMDQYNIALRIDPQFEPALRGNKRLHRILASGGHTDLGATDEEDIDEQVDELSNGDD
ncbi:uncharacterized protein EV422DRAFT_143875 [Fimicolochytrium jonesii]|uniref:uncharacterized protein n=1 Tax=Fimicolochytrium jonesii TaxID=1396493 RepID=UPI0022FDE6D6|nr:uncharacterized protein EV422DRAFT_143875 [Fimicolochytrium jonesii]KAI8825860.1 hypothetical protein EV422DRAFT_143875 [Fimicolochytrium jonesii]